jgi:hypothetical protein
MACSCDVTAGAGHARDANEGRSNFLMYRFSFSDHRLKAEGI